MLTRGRHLVAVCALIGALTATWVASATTLGGVSAVSLSSFNLVSTTSAPGVVTCDDFSRAAATGSALNSRPVQLPANCGSVVWTSHLGTWTITTGQLAATTANATATIAAGQTQISAEATILNANGSSRIAGVAIDHSGSTRIYLAAALSGPGTAQLRLVNGSTVTTLATAAATIGASATLRITRIGNVVTVAVDGALVITYTLTAAQVTTLSGGTRVGLYWNSGSTIRFTTILATQPTSP